MTKKQNNFIREPLKGSLSVTVEIGSQVSFVYIVRMDGELTVTPIAKKVSTDYLLDEGDFKQTLLKEYNIFFSKLISIFQWCFSQKGYFELHLYDPNELETAVRHKAEKVPIVSLDPIISQGVHNLAVSRAYYLGGKRYIGQIASPGKASLDIQYQQIADSLSGKPVCIVVDDVFSRGSILASLDGLKRRGVQIQKVIPGIQIGSLDEVTKSGVTVDPIARYKTADGADIFNRIDLGDPRDHLLGASGLVVCLPNKKYGRAPYVLPFISTTVRSSVPPQAERDFAFKILEANRNFFCEIERKVERPLLLRHMDEHFLAMMQDLYGFDSSIPMLQIIDWATDNIDAIWKITQQLGEIQEQLETMNPGLTNPASDGMRHMLDHLVERLRQPAKLDMP